MYDTNLPGFKKLLAQVIQWYQNNSDIEPLKPVFAGKVVDTAGNPVAGARLILSRLEYYQNDRGGRSRREVELAKRLSEDDGGFSFDEVTNDNHYLLDVTADGFLAKERLHIQRLDDGRYRYQGYNEPADNVITMQMPGKISGTVIGANGRPLADAELELFANVRYSSAPRDRTITTDSQGKFTKDDMSAEPAILSYTRYRRVQQDRRARREYDGLCGALIIENKEGQELSDIVLDLSKSVCSLELQVQMHPAGLRMRFP
jgi:protocatechuate 3,4-dioxygenase beta subunit